MTVRDDHARPYNTESDRMTEAEFCQASVSMQIGRFSGPIAQSEHTLLRALKGCSGSALAQLPANGPVVRLENSRLQAVSRERLAIQGKAEIALAQINAEQPQFGFIVDMQDRRLRSIAEPGEPSWPVFSFNRQPQDCRRILWPLPTYHDIECEQFFGGVQPDAVPWADKISRAVWRGVTCGRVMGANPGEDGLRLKGLIRRYEQGRLALPELTRLIQGLPRFATVNRVRGDPRFDFGFVDGDGYIIAQTPAHAAFERPRMSRLDMQRCKYIAVLRGVDVGSSFSWVMNSGSVGLVMQTPFETFASNHFHPWAHFIPFREDGADLADKFEWAEAHPDACEQMTRRAPTICRFLARADLRKEILGRLIAQVGALARV